MQSNQGVIRKEEQYIKALSLIYEKLDMIFSKDKDLVYVWLTSSNRNFGFKTPLYMLENEPGGVLDVLEYLEISMTSEGS